MNPNQTQHKGIIIEVFPDHVVLKTDTSTFPFLPGFGAKIKTLIGTARKMEDFPALPEFISDEPYFIFFNEDGTLRLRNETDVLSFTFNDCDTLCEVIDIAVDKVRDERTLRPGKRGSVSFTSPDPVIEGR